MPTVLSTVSVVVWNLVHQSSILYVSVQMNKRSERKKTVSIYYEFTVHVQIIWGGPNDTWGGYVFFSACANFFFRS